MHSHYYNYTAIEMGMSACLGQTTLILIEQRLFTEKEDIVGLEYIHLN